MVKKIKYILILSAIFIIAMYSQSFARITTNDPTVNSGETVKITINSQEPVASGAISISSNSGLTFVNVTGGTKNGQTVAFAKEGNITSGLAEYTFKAPETAENKTYTVTFSAVDMADEEGNPIANSSATATVKVKGSNPTPEETKPEEKPSTPSTPEQKPEEKPTTPTTPSTPSKSSDTSLKSLSISPFGKINKTSSGVYDITVDNKYDKVTVTAVANSSKAKVTKGNDDYELEEGTNQIKIVVTAEDGSTETHKVIIRRKTAETEQPITPPNVIEKEDKEDKKDEEVKEEEKELGLLNLVITGVQLNPSFAEDVYEYTAEFAEDTDSLEVIASANMEGATVEVAGNTNLVIGENLITIMVKSKDGKVTKTYQVTVAKNEPEVVPAVTDNTVNDNNENTVLAGINEDQELKNQIGKIVIIAAAAIIAVILLGIIIIAYTKKKDNDSSDDSQKKTDRKKEKLGKDAFVVSVDEDESYRELEKLSEIRNRKSGFEENSVKSKVDRLLGETAIGNSVEKETRENQFKDEVADEFVPSHNTYGNSSEFANGLDEIEVSVPTYNDEESLRGRKGRRFK